METDKEKHLGETTNDPENEDCRGQKAREKKVMRYQEGVRGRDDTHPFFYTNIING
jgi:hypothetical protein